jgi:branched-chain amino acid aminotransferase
VFFVGKDGNAYTSPAGSVLVGVTRTKVIEICSRMGLPVLEKAIHHRDLTDIQGAFITGTTVDVTPIRSISRIHIESATNPLVRKIVAEYENEIAEYIRTRR